MAKTIKDIEVITGETNPKILLIAPHGVSGDDDNAGKLARAIQKKLGCHAIINEVFKKPEKDENDKYGEPNIKEYLADLNYIPHAQAYPKFIDRIKASIADTGNTHVFWIHGIDDNHLPDEEKKLKASNLKCLVGYGQGKGNGNSMDENKAKDFIKFLNDNNLPTMATHNLSKKYRGASATNMNQYFKITGGDLASVQSVQLEFADKEVREGKHIAETAVKVAKAISDLLKCQTVNIPEEKEDKTLVMEATEKVMGYIKENHKNSIGVGRYLIEMFYDNNFDFARNGKKVKGKSLHKMLNDLEEKPDTPSKSWFYNTINLAVDAEEFKDDVEYGKLNLSHKIYLTYLNKDEKQREAKLGLIKKIATKGMSISDLLKRIAEIKGKPVLLKVEPMDDEVPSPDTIPSMTPEQVSGYKQNSEQKVKDINKQIADLNEKLKKHIEFIDKAEKRLTSSFDKAA